jgi:hypothetical protein
MSADTPAEKRPTAALNPTRKMAEQNSVSIRTIERWADAGILPPPVRINGRKFWPAGTMPKTDAA